jgi:hypothetical protein
VCSCLENDAGRASGRPRRRFVALAPGRSHALVSEGVHLSVFALRASDGTPSLGPRPPQQICTLDEEDDGAG